MSKNRFSKKNIVMITIDCLRADFVGAINKKIKFTPAMSSLADRGVVFTKAFSNGPGTNQSFPSILTSTYFLMHNGMKRAEFSNTIAESLKAFGYRTVAFHSNPFLSAKLGWNKGFDEFYDFMDVIKSPSAFVTRQKTTITGRLINLGVKMLNIKKNEKIQKMLKKIYYKAKKLEVPYIEAKELNEYVIQWLEKNKEKKFYLWMHYMDPHYPFIPPEPYLYDFSSRKEAFDFNLTIDEENVTKDQIEILKRLYIGEIKYVDKCIREFLDYMESNDLLRNTIIFLMADHGNAFFEHNKMGHAYDILYNEVIHVPLIITGVTDDNKRIDRPVQLLDVSPTILDMIGAPKPKTFMGTSMLPLIEGNSNNSPTAIFSESAKPDLVNVRYDVSKKAVSCIYGEWKLIINELLQTKELYNIDKDFKEKHNVIDSYEDISAKLFAMIKTHLNREKIYKMKYMKQYAKIKNGR